MIARVVQGNDLMAGWGGLRSRLVLLVLIALVPVFGLFTYSATQNQQTALTLAQVSLQAQVLLAAAHQQRLVERTAQLLGDMASDPSIKDTRIRLCVPYLKNLQSQQPGYSSMGVLGLDGKVTCDAYDSSPEVYAGDRAFFKQVLRDKKFAVGELGEGRASGRLGIGFGMPVYSNEGVFNGVAFAVLDINAIAAVLTAGHVLDGAQLRVTDRLGTILASYPPREDLLGGLDKDAVVLAAARAGHAGAREAAGHDGVARVYAYAPVGGVANDALFVAISVPREVLTTGPRALLRLNLAALLGMTVFGMGCAWWTGARLIVNPANAILKQAHEVSQGKLSARIPVGFTQRGELGQIASTFNRIAESLEERRAQLDRMVIHLGKEQAQLELIINSMSEGVVAVDLQGHFLLFNAAAQKMFLATGAGATMKSWRQQHQVLGLDGTPYAENDRPMSLAMRGETVDDWDVLVRIEGVPDRVLRMSVRPLKDPQGAQMGGLTVFTDITERKATEDFVHAQEQVLELVARGVALPRSLEAIVRLIEASAPQGLCTILLVERQQLRHCAAVRMPPAFGKRIDPMPIGPEGGACGTAAYFKKTVIVENIATDPLMRHYRDVAHEFGLGACWSVPVLSVEGEVMATFAIYHPAPRQPGARDMALMETAVRLARIAIERDRAQAALLGSKARFRELAENIDDVFYSVDSRTGQVLYISPGYEKVWGRSCASLYADPKSYARAVLSEDFPQFKRARMRSRAGEEADVEYRITGADGQLRWIRDHAFPVFNDAGELERFVGTARDITERKLAELALTRTNRALQVLSRSSMAMSQLDDETRLLAEVCRVAVEVGGYRMAWVGYAQHDAGRGMLPMAHAGDEDGYVASIQVSWRDDHPSGLGPVGLAIRRGLPSYVNDISRSENFMWQTTALAHGFHSAICLPLRDGPRSFGVLCLYAGEPQQFPADEVRLLQELADNLAFGITSLRARLERRRNQEALRESALKMEEQASLLDRAQDAIMVRNLDRTIRYWNKGAERLYGWTAEEVLGNTMDEFMYRSTQVLAASMAQTLANGGDWSGELEQVARDGSTVYIEARWTVVRDEQGHVNGVLGINTDIRERRRAREEILQLNASLEERVQQRTAQLEFANTQLEAFSYSVSHDLRTPLSSIDGFSHLLEKAMVKAAKTAKADQADPLTERSRHYLARIQAGVSQMGELIDAMLTLARVSRSRLRWEPVDLSALAGSLQQGYQEREPGRVSELHVQPGLLVHGDPRLLRQVLDNLLGNAWKFSAGQPRTEITFGSQTGSAGETVYFMRDNGAGFDMAYAEKLFGAFQRLHSQSEFAGTGIGLATVQRIIARHGGRVWGESSPGHGATFYFTLGSATL